MGRESKGSRIKSEEERSKSSAHLSNHAPDTLLFTGKKLEGADGGDKEHDAESVVDKVDKIGEGYEVQPLTR